MKVKRENLVNLGVNLGVVFLIAVVISTLTAVYGEKLANFIYGFTGTIVKNAVENAHSRGELFIFFFGTMMGLIVLIGCPIALLMSWLTNDESLDEWYQRTTGRKKRVIKMKLKNS